VSIQAIWEAQGDAFVSFWRLEDLFALGGAPISATPPPTCEAQILVGSITLRAEADSAGMAIGYPLRDERFVVQRITIDNRWVQVIAGAERGWLNWDVVDLTDSCTASPYVLERGTEAAAVALSYRLNSLTFTTDDRFLALSRYSSGSREQEYRNLLFVDVERGVIISQENDAIVPGSVSVPPPRGTFFSPAATTPRQLVFTGVQALVGRAGRFAHAHPRHAMGGCGHTECHHLATDRNRDAAPDTAAYL